MDVLKRISRINSLLAWLRASETTTGIILAVAVGIVAGLGALAFKLLIKGFQSLFFGGGAMALGFLGQYYIIVLPAIGGLFVGLLVYFGAREAKGHGVPEVMEAVAIHGGRIRPRVAVVKSLASSICIGSGGSVGREGPIVQIGSSFGSALGQWLRLPEEWTKTLVLCGAAGGISATFNAPIGGIFFALEVLTGRFMTRSFILVAISSVTADMIAHVFLGDSPAFTIPEWSMVSYWEILLYAGLGIISALVSLGFIHTLYKCEDLFDALIIPEYLKPLLGGIVIGFIGLYSLDLFGVGYGEVYWVSNMGIDQALVGKIGLTVLLILVVLKIAAASITLGSGGSGGVFAPSLFIGSMLGGALGEIAHRLFPMVTAPSGAYALVGMGAVFAGATRAPITAIIMLFEMTRDYSIILPLMTAVIISTVVSRGLSRETIYTLKLRRRGIDIYRREEADAMKTITVEQAMTRNFPTVFSAMPASELIAKLMRTGHHGFPVVDESGRFCGVVTLMDVENATMRENTNLTVGDIATKSPAVVYPDQSLYDALVQFTGDREVGRIPVVDRRDPGRLLGVLRRHDIIKAYTKAVGKKASR